MSDATGPPTPVVAGGLVGSALVGAFLFWPSVRDPDRRPLSQPRQSDILEELAP